MNISDQQWFGDRNCYGFLVSAVCVSPTNGWSFDPLFRVMPRPTMTLDSETHCCGPRVKMWWPWCWIWTCGLFSGDNPTPTIVVVPSNADNVKIWVIFTIKIIKSRVFFVNKHWDFTMKIMKNEDRINNWDDFSVHEDWNSKIENFMGDWRDATSGCWMIGHGQPYVHVASSKHGWLVESGCLEPARCFSSRSKLDSPWCSLGALLITLCFFWVPPTYWFEDHKKDSHPP